MSVRGVMKPLMCERQVHTSENHENQNLKADTPDDSVGVTMTCWEGNMLSCRTSGHIRSNFIHVAANPNWLAGIVVHFNTTIELIHMKELHY